MYEVFLTTYVQGAEVHRALSILDGLCAHSPWYSLQRVLFFNGPNKPHALKLGPDRKQGAYVRHWAELSAQLARQSFVVPLRFEVFANKDFGGEVPERADGEVLKELNAEKAVLSWKDIPDPHGGRPSMQRQKIEIEGKGLVGTLLENGFTYKSEIIEESNSFFRDDIEFVLVRYWAIPPPAPAADGSPLPVPRLGAWPLTDPPKPNAAPDPNAIKLVDQKWMLYVRTHAVEDNSPEKILRCHDELKKVREELSGIFDFKVFDRRSLDSRNLGPVDNAPKQMPQKLRA